MKTWLSKLAGVITLALALMIGAPAPIQAAQNATSCPTTGTLSGLALVQCINNAFSTTVSQFSGASAPTSPTTWQLWADTTTNILKIYDGTIWEPIGSFSGSQWVPFSNGVNPTAISTTGSANAYVLTYSPAPTALVTGQVYPAIANFSNTGSATLNINSLGAKNITKNGTTALASGDIASGQVFLAVYDGTEFQLVTPTPQTAVPIYQSAIAGLLPTAVSGTSTTAAVTISAGQATDSTDAQVITSAGHSWTVSNGNAANGYQGGTTLPNSSTIHFYEIWGSSGEASFASTSLTPTLPTGYTYYRRIFSIPTNSSGALLPGTTIETAGGALTYYLATQVQNVSVTNLTTSRSLYALSVPSGLKVQPLIRAASGTSGALVLVESPDETDIAPTSNASSAPGNDLAGSGVSQSPGFILTTNTSAEVAARSSVSSTTFYIITRGWIDFRRN